MPIRLSSSDYTIVTWNSSRSGYGPPTPLLTITLSLTPLFELIQFAPVRTSSRSTERALRLKETCNFPTVPIHSLLQWDEEHIKDCRILSDGTHTLKIT